MGGGKGNHELMELLPGPSRLDREVLGGVVPEAPLTFCLPCPAEKEPSDLIPTSVFLNASFYAL